MSLSTACRRQGFLRALLWVGLETLLAATPGLTEPNTKQPQANDASQWKTVLRTSRHEAIQTPIFEGHGKALRMNRQIREVVLNEALSPNQIQKLDDLDRDLLILHVQVDEARKIKKVFPQLTLEEIEDVQRLVAALKDTHVSLGP